MDQDERSKTAEKAPPSAQDGIEDAPDPDEDDLDDLDDMLDEFSTAKLNEPQPTQPKQDALVDSRDEPVPVDGADNTFAKELQDQMASFLGSMDDSPEMRRELEKVMNDLGKAADLATVPDASATPKGDAQSSTGDDSFQETIRKTMERMQTSGDQAGAAAQAEGSDDMLAQMLKEMQTVGLSGEDDEEGFNKMLLGMMEQLTNKDILYDPMKELHDKFPAWMEKNRASTKAEDLKRYDEQQRLVAEIVGRFEQKDYSDSTPNDREFIMDRMQQMQGAGSPPPDLVGEMDAVAPLGDMDNACPQS